MACDEIKWTIFFPMVINSEEFSVTNIDLATAVRRYYSSLSKRPHDKSQF